MPTIALIDPLTLLGRETAAELDRVLQNPDDLAVFHTNPEEEHEIADVAGHPAIIPALAAASDLDSVSIAVLAGDHASARHAALEEAAVQRPDLIIIDASTGQPFVDRSVPVIDPRDVDTCTLVRPAHPALVVTRRLLEALEAIELDSVSVHAIDPVSVFGEPAVQELAQQAAQRLQGAQVETLVQNRVLAFNLVQGSGDLITEDAQRLFSDLDITASRSLGGCFHGTLVHLTAHSPLQISEDEVLAGLDAHPDVQVAETDLVLDAVPDSDTILTARPVISPRGSTLSIIAMVDGLRVGGAVTLARLVAGLV
jgi:aspartate-semialdehyde dehydrogenase